ncbi:hypothetical protein CU044_4365 [Streptomyces sp. L-9-10]|nr:hypothetical protein CU044_4365 [Streptomyces sp. L-9-10]
MLESFAQVYGLRGSTVLWPAQFLAQGGEPAHNACRHALRPRVEDEAEHGLGTVQVAQEQMAAGKIDVGGEQVSDRLIVVFGTAIEPDRGVGTGDGLLNMLPPAHGQVARPGVRELLGGREGEDARTSSRPGIASRERSASASAATAPARSPAIAEAVAQSGDWVFGSHLVDEALQAVGLTRAQLPARLFCPQVVTDTGAKLSKSLIREGCAPLPEGAAAWMLDTRQWPGTIAEFAEQLLTLTDTLLSNPRHFFRSYSASEIGRIMTAPTTRSIPAP